MDLRRYQSVDLEKVMRLYQDTIHAVNKIDYTPTQLTAWASHNADKIQWDRSLLENYSIVAVKSGMIVGFGDISAENYLDRLYVHKNFQRQGIASAICEQLEKRAAQGTITVHASITARDFFKKRNYHTVKEQEVNIAGVLLRNYLMEKCL
ncbi:MAG TPA: GNAT family N-acetyltransferase [Candidatus Cloacimonadota bacterium]|nr:GNAT family N-acetyltransferase [Candidatus Cloacimonadales bacterium]HPY96958.1 GNAT family N-acetyltransferase [Candidatus Cloacimonadota bacterium]HQB41632.1 GNAT family N-acetyltransferase [Candidatus Cloacimonadota bacterium]